MKNSARSVFDGVPDDPPELTRAVELQQCAAGVGFDWADMPPVLAKIREELVELETEIASGVSPERIRDELGDLLFASANLARKLGIDPEQALRGTNQKFQRRFHTVEAQLARQGRLPQDATLQEMDAIWEQAKHDEA
ncbi:MAG: MazG nucleotide pyrophosphohydrolase domain-containing protein [Gammaproteobacteria bacterium]